MITMLMGDPSRQVDPRVLVPVPGSNYSIDTIMKSPFTPIVALAAIAAAIWFFTRK